MPGRALTTRFEMYGQPPPPQYMRRGGVWCQCGWRGVGMGPPPPSPLISKAGYVRQVVRRPFKPTPGLPGAGLSFARGSLMGAQGPGMHWKGTGPRAGVSVAVKAVGGGRQNGLGRVLSVTNAFHGQLGRERVRERETATSTLQARPTQGGLPPRLTMHPGPRLQPDAGRARRPSPPQPPLQCTAPVASGQA